MKIGVFDSGLGGLVIHKAISHSLPGYDMVYLGDTLHVPYGGRSTEAIYDYSARYVDFLFRQHECQIIIIACNTASAAALRNLQQEYLVSSFPERRILGVVVPTLEEAVACGHKRIGLLATQYSVRSNIYAKELKKIDSSYQIFSKASPLLVPLIEHDGLKWIEPVLKDYLSDLMKHDIEALILGCTHYPMLKEKVKKLLHPSITLLSQDEIIPAKLANYLKRHPEHESKLTKNSHHDFLVTDFSPNYKNTAKTLYGQDVIFKKVSV